MKGSWSKALLMPLLLTAIGARAATMQSATNIMFPGDINSGGEDYIASNTNYTLGDALGEAVSGPRMDDGTYAASDGLRQIMAYPNAVTTLAAQAGAGGGPSALSWSAPGYDGNNGALQVGTSYYVALATYAVATPFNAFNGLLVVVSTSGVATGAAQQMTLSSLSSNTTYFVSVWTVDADGNSSFVSNTASFTTLSAAIANFLATAGLKQALLTWSAPAQIGSFHVYRSTDNVTFTRVAAPARTSFDDAPLMSYATYYYRVAPVDGAGLEGSLSQTDSVVPFTLPPLVPLGVTVTASSTSVTLAWSATTHFSDGTVFFSSAAPASDELQGYNVYRSTSICGALTLLTNLSTGTLSLNDFTNGKPYFYQLQSFNSLAASTATVVLDSFGSAYYVTDDCQSRAVVPQAVNQMLAKGVNGYNEDIAVIAMRRPQDTGGAIMQSVGFTALVGGHTAIPGFTFSRPITYQLHYLTSGGGSPIPQVAALEARAETPLAASSSDLGMYWNNGLQYQKMYGVVDQASQLVTVQSPNPGIYQVRAQARSAGAVFDVSNVSSRVITPNGDGLNDTLIFTYDPGPNHVLPEGKIYDMEGRFVSDMTSGLVPSTLTWDGRMNGRYATSGVYVYQIKGDGKVFNGSIVVAR